MAFLLLSEPVVKILPERSEFRLVQIRAPRVRFESEVFSTATVKAADLHGGEAFEQIPRLAAFQRDLDSL